MKKLFLTLLAIAACATGAHAQLFWKISGNGLERPSYLFGTHHVAPASVIDSIPGFADALANVDKVYGEMDMAAAQTPAAQQILMSSGMAPADSTLSKLLTPAQLDSVNTILGKYMGPMADIRQMDPLKPNMVSTVIAMMQAQQQFPGFNPAQQLDLVVQQRAKAAGKEIGGLETVEEQATMLFGMPMAEQAEQLMEAVRHDVTAMEFAGKLAQAYLACDLDTMLSLMEDPVMGMGSSADRLINTRNANWVRVMAGLLPAASVLIAVGAGHLPGEKGLISLLRQKGYTVEPVE